MLSWAQRAELILVQHPGIGRFFHDAVAQAPGLEQYRFEPDLELFPQACPWARSMLADPPGLADQVCRLADAPRADSQRVPQAA
jgi:hypothetical protein